MNHGPVPRVVWTDEEVAELLLFLPVPQAAELEQLAHSRGLSMGRLVRLLIRDYLVCVGADMPLSANSKGEGR